MVGLRGVASHLELLPNGIRIGMVAKLSKGWQFYTVCLLPIAGVDEALNKEGCTVVVLQE